MLPHEARLGAASADVDHAERRSGNDGKGERCSEDLSAAFSL
jgi:hypothetical protein